MKPQPTPEQIQKLPKWAQLYIADVLRERSVAIRALHEFKDNQTPAPFFYDEMVCTGEQQGPTVYRRYIQTHQIEVEYKGVRLQVVALADDNLTLRWDTPDRLCNHVAMVPTSFQTVELMTKENMR